MKTNSRVKKQKTKSVNQSGSSTDLSKIQKATDLQEVIPNPDYSSMEKEVEKINDPVSFEALKAFYGLE